MFSDKNIRSEEKRIAWMDIFRGWGIILMIMGHVEFGNHFDFFIHANVLFCFRLLFQSWEYINNKLYKEEGKDPFNTLCGVWIAGLCSMVAL